jgi:uncharacterized protein (TIGR04255 family)
LRRPKFGTLEHGHLYSDGVEICMVVLRTVAGKFGRSDERIDMAWRPINSEHAIERVRIILNLQRFPPSKIFNKVVNQLDQRRTDSGFGAMVTQQMPPFPFPVPAGMPQSFLPPGGEFRRLNTEGEPIEVVSFIGQEIIYDTSEYISWEIFIKRVIDVMGPSIAILLQSEDIGNLALEYMDRFFYDGAVDQSRPEELLSGFNEMIPNADDLKGEMWHLHRGWFERHSTGRRLLINQNFDASDGVVDGSARRGVGITTRAEARVGMWPIDDDNLQPHLETMHTRVNSVFAQALTAEMCKTVGIGRVEGA